MDDLKSCVESDRAFLQGLKLGIKLGESDDTATFIKIKEALLNSIQSGVKELAGVKPKEVTEAPTEAPTEPFETLTLELFEAKNRIALLEQTLRDIRLRMIFVGWPSESMWKSGAGKWIPDWRAEFAAIEYVLHGTPIDTERLESIKSYPANRLPKN